MIPMEASQWAKERGVDTRHSDQVVHISHP
jgi:hypothetical protein